MAPDLMAANKLPALMRELGYACTASEASFLKLLSQAPRVDEATAAEVLSVMVTSLKGLEDNLGLHATLNAALDGGYLGEPGSSTWNFNVVVDAIKRSSPQLDWAKVADALDTPAFLVPDQQAFLVLAAAYKRAAGGQLPVKAFVGRLWSNAMGQASFLKFATGAAPETFSFAASEQRIEALDALHGGKAPLGSLNQAWASIDLLNVLCKLEQGAPQQLVRQMVDVPLKLCPEVLLVAMASVAPDGNQWPPLQREVRALRRALLGGAAPARRMEPAWSVARAARSSRLHPPTQGAAPAPWCPARSPESAPRAAGCRSDSSRGAAVRRRCWPC
jgi:CCR4-NOT transcription complex subunit 1